MMQTMTVAELREALDPFDDGMPVVACVSYGDRARTMQAIAVTELEEVNIARSSYSDSGWAVTEHDGESVVVLNYDLLD